jgi:hypothetical protein
MLLPSHISQKLRDSLFIIIDLAMQVEYLSLRRVPIDAGSSGRRC